MKLQSVIKGIGKVIKAIGYGLYVALAFILVWLKEISSHTKWIAITICLCFFTFCVTTWAYQTDIRECRDMVKRCNDVRHECDSVLYLSEAQDSMLRTAGRIKDQLGSPSGSLIDSVTFIEFRKR